MQEQRHLAAIVSAYIFSKQWLMSECQHITNRATDAGSIWKSVLPPKKKPEIKGNRITSRC